MGGDDLGELLAAVAREPSSAKLGKLLSAVEREGPRALRYDEILKPKHLSFRIGITGPPGAGKSTLIAQILKRFSQKRVAVIAVDPTSPITNGAVLGDRIRYAESSLNQNIFIRSLGTRGSLGGLAAQAYLLARAFDACKFDITIIETVGVGQVEVDVMNVADVVVLVLVPESGDSIQIMKSGVTEIANVIVVNKSDRPGADSLRREIEAQIEKSVLSISATENTGIDPLVEWLNSAMNELKWREMRVAPKKLQAEAVALKRDQIEAEIKKAIHQIETADSLKSLFLLK